MPRRRVRKETVIDKAGGKVAAALELPPDVFSGMPRLSMVGNRELIVEGHTGIIEYSDGCVKLGGGIFIICVAGRGLELVSFSQESLGVRGVILSITFQG